MKFCFVILFLPITLLAQNKYGLTPVKLEEYKQSVKTNLNNELVNLTNIPGVVLDIRYATVNNFIGEKIYNLPRAYARKPVAEALKKIQAESKAKISLADLIVLAGSAGVEQAAKNAGRNVKVPFKAGRTDATAAQTDAHSFAVLEPKADGFRNYVKAGFENSSEDILIDKAQLLTLTAPEMTVLLGGLRTILNSGKLNQSHFSTLLDNNIEWKPATAKGMFEGFNRTTGKKVQTASRVDLIFGSHSELRSYSEVYATKTAKPKFTNDFVKAWVKVMNLG
jgi:catalase (peroxidase I)